MKAAIFGDIHGNATALDAVIKDMDAQGVERRICLGDIAVRGPQPAESMALIAEQQLEGQVVGNTDQRLFQGFPDGFVREAETLARMEEYRDWALERLDETAIQTMMKWPLSYRFQLGPHTVTVVHSSPRSTEDWYDSHYSDEQLLPIFSGAGGCDILVYGHIHTPFVRRINRRWLINSGSVGNPIDGDARASYVVLSYEDGGLHIQLRRVPYDVHQVGAIAKERGFPNAKEYADAIRAGQPMRQ